MTANAAGRPIALMSGFSVRNLTTFFLSRDQVDCERLNQLCHVENRGVMKTLLQATMRAILILNPDCYVGPNTFYPKQTCHERFPESPILAAAKMGCVTALKFYLSTFGNVIDVNVLGTCIFTRKYRDGDTISEVLHKCTALNAACLSDTTNLEVVKLLVAHGAHVNVPSCRKSTPLMGAAFSGKLDIVKYLVKHGANVDTANLMGNAPLCAAAMGGHHKVLNYLLKKGADVDHRTMTGDMAVHIAATEGHLKVVKELLAHGATVHLQSKLPTPLEDPTPHPILLAASEGHENVVDLLLNHPDVSPELKSDALLVLGATLFEQRKPGRMAILDRLWTQALGLRETYSVKTAFAPPVAAYGNRIEIQDFADYDALRQSERSDLYYQCLIIRERVMGYGELSLIRRISQSVMELLIVQRLHDAELLWTRLLEMMVSFVGSKSPEFVAHFFSHSFYSRWRDLMDGFLVIFDKIVPLDFEINYEPLIVFGLKGIEFLKVPSLEPECLKPHPHPLLFHTLILFSSWLHQTHTKGCTKKTVGDQVVFDPTCEALGREFVSSNLLPTKDTTLLHIALSHLHTMVYKSISLLVAAMLRWGADSLVDLPDGEGNRPLQLAVKNADSRTVVHLLDCGAHLDSVDWEGMTAEDVLREKVYINDRYEGVFNPVPRPLACQASHCIVREGLPYKDMDLPSHLKDYIALHDKPPHVEPEVYM